MLWYRLLLGKAAALTAQRFRLPMLVFVRAWPSYRAAYGTAVFSTVVQCVEDSRTPLCPHAVLMGRCPTAANLNLYGGQKSHVAWHCDDEPLFVVIRSSLFLLSLGSYGRRSPVRTVKGVRTGSTKVTSCFWMGSVRTNTFTVRVLAWQIGVAPWLRECWDPCLPVRMVHPSWDLL